MYQASAQLIHRAAGNVLLAAMTFGLAVIAHSHAIAADENAPVGRIDFEAAKLPEANVEVDLSQDMFKDLFGIGDAAVAGVAETLFQASAGSEDAKGTKLAAEQLEAARHIIQLASKVVREVRVRVYDSLPKEIGDPQSLFNAFDEQLRAGNWETLARVHDKSNLVRVSTMRNEGAIKGMFVTVTDGHNAVIANVVCDISPENVKKLTSTVTKIGLENGLAQAIERKMKRFPVGVESHTTVIINDSEHRKHIRPVAPTPPAAPPKPAEK